MVASVLEQCRACVTTLKTIVSTLSVPHRQGGRVHHEQVNDELERFSLWMGNIGALHQPESSMSLESRLREANDVLTHIQELLDNLNEVAGELLEIVSGEREEETVSIPYNDGEEDDLNEETELLEEFEACITRLFRVSYLIRQAAPTDLFAKALSRNRYQFNDQFDIAHVGEKYPKLATEEFAWLKKRLGRAITQRRHYLSYIRDHRERLEGMLTHEETPESVAPKSHSPIKQLSAVKRPTDSSSRPSTFFTKASSLTPGHITPQMLAVEEESAPEDDARSYTTISRSIDGDLDSSTTIRIPKLDRLRIGSKKEVECPFCFRMKKFKNERTWQRHVFSDLRPYVCTFLNCDAPYFGDINEWFRHEMQSHRVRYICRFCQSKTFQLKERYLTHIRKQHPEMLEDGEEQPILDIARKPLDQIPAQECPCCSEWPDRLKERAVVANMPFNASDHILSVVPTVFKRHLASHLEQLALFAIPIDLAGERDVDSNVAIEDDMGALLEASDPSNLTFGSSRPSSSARKGQSFDDIPVARGIVEAVAPHEGSGREEMTRLLERKGSDISITRFSSRTGSGEDKTNDGDAQDAFTMDLKVRYDPIIPTYEGFKIHARQLNPRLVDYMVERITQEQMQRYKRLLEFRVRHLHAVKNRNCPSSTFCADLGGESQQLPPRAGNEDSDAPFIGFQITAPGSSDDDEPPSDGNVVAAQFPSGVPLPPVKRLPAEFECPLCFKVKKFYKPSDWTKHVHEDVQPFTCTFPNCGEPKSFKRKADWVRHENERHRQLENWACQIADCNHTCYRKDNFVQHLVREHKIAEPRARTSRGANEYTPSDTDDIRSLVERCRRNTTKQPKDEPCRFCGNICNTWKKLTVHLSKHMEQISMPILLLVEQKQINTDTIIYPVVENPEHSRKLSTIPGESPAENSPRYNPNLRAEHLDSPSGFRYLGSVLSSQGKYEEAEAMYRRDLEASEKVLGPEHLDTLTSASNLGSILSSQGKHKEAEAMHRRALEGREKVLGPEHPDTLVSISSLGCVLCSQGKYKEAETMQRRALGGHEKVHGPEHPDTLTSVSNLGLVLSSQGKYEEAEAMHRRALEGREKVLGSEHLYTLSSFGYLRSALLGQGKYEEAEAMYRRDLEASEKVLGPGHLDTLTSVSNLGSILSSQGKHKEAKAMHRRALEGREKVLGPEHPNTLTSVSNLGSVLSSQGKHKEAEAMHRRALEGREKVLGPEHPNTLTSISNLGSALSSQGKYDEAEAMHRRALERREKVLGPEHPDTLTNMNDLAFMLKAQGHRDKAIALMMDCSQLEEHVLGPQHPHTASSLRTLNKWRMENADISN